MKKSLRRVSFLMALLFMSVMILSGCGGAGNNTQSAAETTGQVTAADTTAAGETSGASNALPLIGDTMKYDPNVPVNDGKDITINFWDQTELHGFYEKWTNEYSKIHPNVKWNFTTANFTDLFTKLPIALQSGTGPDIFHMHNMYTQVLVPNMAPYPEEVMPLDQLKEDFVGVDVHIIDGKVYFLDYGIMTSGMFYNKKLWADAGLTDSDIPKTWDKFIEVARKLTKTDNSGKMTVAGFNSNSMTWDLMLSVAIQHGAYLFDQSGTKAVLNTPTFANACKFVYDLYNKEKIGDVKMPENLEAFANEKSAIIYQWGWIGSYFKENKPELQFGYFPTPTDDGNPPPAYGRNNGEETAGVSAKASPEAQKVAFDFIKYVLCNNDALIDHNLQVYVAPAKKALANRPEISGDPALAGQMSILDRTFWPGAVPSQYWDGMPKFIQDPIMSNNQTPESVLPKAEETINKDISNTGFVSVERMYSHADEMQK